MFSYETNNEIAGWCAILLFVHVLLLFGWGLHGDEQHHKFWQKYGRDPRENEISNYWLYFGAYVIFSLVFYPVCGVYFMGQNVDENKRRTEARYQEIYQQGMTAAENEIPDSACPYRKSGGKHASNSPDERKWLEGWTAKKIQMNKGTK
jgi:hypothetical protein